MKLPSLTTDSASKFSRLPNKFNRLPNRFTRSSNLVPTVPVGGDIKGTVLVRISATATPTLSVTRSATASVTITATANGQQTDQQYYRSANISVTIEATADGGLTTQTHSGTASCQVNLSASAIGFNPNTDIPDETANGNHMTINGSPTFSTDAAVGTRAFDVGNSDYGLVENSFQDTFRSPFSFSVWYKPDQADIGSNVDYLLYTDVNGTGDDYYRLYHFGKKLRWTTDIGSSPSTLVDTASDVWSSSSVYKHIVVTVASDGSPTFYINGSAVSMTTDSTPEDTDISNYTNTSGFRIGSGVEGIFDDVSMWSTELTSTQVSNLYNSGNGTDLTGSSNLAGWWKMGDSNVTSTTHSGTATVSVGVTASASGTHIQSDESIVEGLTGKLCWFDANDITGSSNGDALSSWPSRHDSGVSASNSTSSTQPIYNTNQVNSLPAVNFDADYLEVNYGSNTTQPVTAFIVCAYDVTSGGGSNNALDGRDNPSGYRAVNFSMRSTGWGSYAGSSWMAPTSGSPDTDWHYFTVYLNGASSYVRKDGASHATGNPGTQGTNGQILGMWKGKNTSYYMNGKIAEVLIFDGTLSDTNRNTTESYLADKYNI
jgi:hypothetical protein